jgi:hypothetical protein
LGGGLLAGVDDKKINLVIFAPRGGDVFALLPDEEPVQLEVFADDGFADSAQVSSEF